MPHLVLDGWERPTRWTEGLGPSVHRWGRAVLKTSGWWRRHDDEALLVEGVVVEYSRPLHPVALVAAHHGQTIVRLWPAVTVERTRAVQRWLAVIARALQDHGAGELVATNIPRELWEDLGLREGGRDGPGS